MGLSGAHGADVTLVQVGVINTFLLEGLLALTGVTALTATGKPRRRAEKRVGRVFEDFVIFFFFLLCVVCCFRGNANSWMNLLMN